MSFPTIKSSDEISKLFSIGKKISNRYILLIYSDELITQNSSLYTEHGQNSGRVAFIAGKKNGNAVWRNAAKRRLREVYRENRPLLKDMDVLLIAKPPITKYPYTDVMSSCNSLFVRIK